MIQQGWVMAVFAPTLALAAEAIAPQPTAEGDFEALKEASPFVRVLSPAETYALRGVAQVADISVATLYNRETKKTFVVTRDESSEEGIKLIEVNASGEFAAVKARVSFAGEEVELAYDESQYLITPGKKGQHGPGGHGGHDGKGPGEPRRGPSKEEMERYKALSEDKQKVFQTYIRHVMESYPDMPREERGNMLRGALIRLSDGQPLDFTPKAPPGGNAPRR